MLSGPGATIRKARGLRKALSLPEVILWQALRRRPGGLKFRRQHPLGSYILDFAYMPAQLAIEVDGEAHARGNRPQRDELRDDWLAREGVRVVRIPATDILSDCDAVVRMIVDRCRSARPLHQPSAGPPPRTGEELR